MTPEQIEEVERMVNEEIQAGLPIIRTTLPKDQAEKLGAEHEFGAKYPDMVSVYSIGPVGATESDPRYELSYSIEFYAVRMYLTRGNWLFQTTPRRCSAQNLKF